MLCAIHGVKIIGRVLLCLPNFRKLFSLPQAIPHLEKVLFQKQKRQIELPDSKFENSFKNS